MMVLPRVSELRPYRSASRSIEKFVQLGILREISGQARNRISQADENLRVIEGTG
jgi:hypothetical protein